MTLGIVIPNFNKERYIETCISSIMAQTLIPDEIWIVDDCSTDNSKEIIKKIQSSNVRIKTIFFDKNKGVSAARNAGILAATTDYITTVDSDDILYERTKLEKEMEILLRSENNGNYNVLAYSKTVYISEEGNVLPGHKHYNWSYLKGKIMIPLLANYHYSDTVPRDYCIRRQLMIDAGLYDITSNYYEDFDLLLRLSKNVEVLFSDNYGVGYRYVANGLSKRTKEIRLQRMEEIKRQYYPNFTPKEKMHYKIVFIAGRARFFLRKFSRIPSKLINGGKGRKYGN